ncbi:MAG: excinuclease ABC subunit UvrB [Candidatus Pacebacteria bacterium]|nr:excinuclease ABC subunit UvrB [Candidatus Paceibacterota bacterium]
MKFALKSSYQPTGDQPQAIEELVAGIQEGQKKQVLLGVTGSGKTFSVSNVIQRVQKPTLVISHNKTLAAQLYQEFRDFFPDNAVSYFVSYYDYYQPEAYLPTTDTYIEKETQINDDIDKLRLAATTNLLTRPDVIVIASVSCIYNLGSPVEYAKNTLTLMSGELIPRTTIFLQLTNLQYQRTDVDLKRASYRVRGETIQVWPAYQDTAYALHLFGNTIERIDEIDPVTGDTISEEPVNRVTIYPAKHYIADPTTKEQALAEIKQDLEEQLKKLRANNKILEAYRLEQRVNYDMDMIRELGFVNGIENYSRYFDGRHAGDPPYTLIDHFVENAKTFGDGSFLTVIDESHITVPQIRGMYNGDQSRKKTLVDYGFRLPSALDNRPLKFEEFMRNMDDMLFVSATPNEWEVSISDHRVIEQLIRPTGLLDPEVEIRKTEGQVEDLTREIIKRKAIGQRTLVTTLTKRMAEALTEYLNTPEKLHALMKDDAYAGELPKVQYLHSDVETLDRSDILDDLRRGVFDVVVGINLLREGLDLPEVSLVAILDADKEGFLRSRTSLVQTMGRAARHQEGHVIMYADRITDSMKSAIDEVKRRRAYQIEHNTKHGLTPTSIQKPIRDQMIARVKDEDGSSHTPQQKRRIEIKMGKDKRVSLYEIDSDSLTPAEKKQYTRVLTREMNGAAKAMNFERAAEIRDVIAKLA